MFPAWSALCQFIVSCQSPSQVVGLQSSKNNLQSFVPSVLLGIHRRRRAADANQFLSEIQSKLPKL